MILANVAAAETLEAKRQHLIYRVHDEPSVEKLNALRETARPSACWLSQVPDDGAFNRILGAGGGDRARADVNISVRAEAQAEYYAPEKLRAFRAQPAPLRHFTSPIRRYADLVGASGMIRAHGWGPDGLDPRGGDALPGTGEHDLMTERAR